MNAAREWGRARAWAALADNSDSASWSRGHRSTTWRSVAGESRCADRPATSSHAPLCSRYASPPSRAGTVMLRCSVIASATTRAHCYPSAASPRTARSSAALNGEALRERVATVVRLDQPEVVERAREIQQLDVVRDAIASGEHGGE